MARVSDVQADVDPGTLVGASDACWVCHKHVCGILKMHRSGYPTYWHDPPANALLWSEVRTSIECSRQMSNDKFHQSSM